MQALEYFSSIRGISGNGLYYILKGSGNDKHKNKRDKELHLWISSDLLLVDEDKKSDALFCVLNEDERGSSDHRPCLEIRSSTPCCPPKDTIRPLTITSSDLCVIHVSQEDSTINPMHIFNLIPMNLNIPTHIIRHLHDIFMTLFYNDDHTSAQLLNNIPKSKTLLELCGCHSITSMDLKRSQIQWALKKKKPLFMGLSPEDEQNGNVLKVNMCNQSPVKSRQSNNNPEQEPWKNRNERRRKSVSFNEDVVVFLFDQKSPTLKLKTECCTFPSGSSSCNLPAFTMEDNGLEWEDEFATLERNDHLQRFKRAPPRSVSLPTPAFTTVTETQQHCQTQRCLFLTYVTESDLDL